MDFGLLEFEPFIQPDPRAGKRTAALEEGGSSRATDYSGSNSPQKSTKRVDTSSLNF